MKVRELMERVKQLNEISFELPQGDLVPAHFHITEMGVVNKHYVDCGGVQRQERMATFQLWVAQDVEHRLTPKKWLSIIDLAAQLYQLSEEEIVVEYQMDTIGVFDLKWNENRFLLSKKTTACLAEDACGIPAVKPRIRLSNLGNANACTPGSGCC
jgi:hypothetical protein